MRPTTLWPRCGISRHNSMTRASKSSVEPLPSRSPRHRHALDVMFRAAARQGRFQQSLILEEVQVPPSLAAGVMRRAKLAALRAAKALALPKIQLQKPPSMVPLCRYRRIKLSRCKRTNLSATGPANGSLSRLNVMQSLHAAPSLANCSESGRETISAPISKVRAIIQSRKSAGSGFALISPDGWQIAHTSRS
jgi:hypothetical protein